MKKGDKVWMFTTYGNGGYSFTEMIYVGYRDPNYRDVYELNPVNDWLHPPHTYYVNKEEVAKTFKQIQKKCLKQLRREYKIKWDVIVEHRLKIKQLKEEME